MTVKQLESKLDTLLCQLSCSDAREAKFGRISMEGRELLTRLSLGRLYLNQWSSEEIEEFRCFVFENF